MLPYLLCININGMANKDTLKPKSLENKILPIGSGLYEKRMIQAIIGVSQTRSTQRAEEDEHANRWVGSLPRVYAF